MAKTRLNYLLETKRLRNQRWDYVETVRNETNLDPKQAYKDIKMLQKQYWGQLIQYWVTVDEILWKWDNKTNQRRKPVSMRKGKTETEWKRRTKLDSEIGKRAVTVMRRVKDGSERIPKVLTAREKWMKMKV